MVDFAVVVVVLGAGLEVVVVADRVEVAAVLALAEDELGTVERLRDTVRMLSVEKINFLLTHSTGWFLRSWINPS